MQHARTARTTEPQTHGNDGCSTIAHSPAPRTTASRHATIKVPCLSYNLRQRGQPRCTSRGVPEAVETMSFWQYYFAVFIALLVCCKDVFLAFLGTFILFLLFWPLLLIVDPIVTIIKESLEDRKHNSARKALLEQKDSATDSHAWTYAYKTPQPTQAAKKQPECTTKPLNKKVLYGLLAIAASVVIVFLMAKPGAVPDTSARLGQITIRYPSSWTRIDNNIYVKKYHSHSGLLMWATAGDYHGTRGIKDITAILSENAEFNGELSETSIGGVKAYRQAITLDGMTGEALFVPTDEGVTLVLGAMPPEDKELQATLKRILDTAVLTPGTECTVTVISQGMTQYTDVVYDYGDGATWTLNVVDENGDGLPTLSAGEVITGWKASDPSVNIVKTGEGSWKFTGITCDVTIDAVWGMPE